MAWSNLTHWLISTQRDTQAGPPWTIFTSSAYLEPSTFHCSVRYDVTSSSVRDDVMFGTCRIENLPETCVEINQ